VCLRPTVSPTDRHAALEAMVAGCRFESWRLPAELLERADGPALTLVDLFEFQERLLELDWFDELVPVDGQRGDPGPFGRES